MGQQLDDLLEAAGHFITVELGVGLQAARVGQLRVDLDLPRLEHLDRHGVGEVGVHELLLLTFEFDHAASLIGDQATARLGRAVEVVSGTLTELGDLGIAELHRQPLTGDLVLDLLNGEVGQVAAGSPGVAVDAEEVLVGAALAARGPEADAALAAGAGQRPLEVVRVAPRAVARNPTAAEDVLDLLPQHFVDQRFVTAGVDQAVEDQLALVVRVGE